MESYAAHGQSIAGLRTALPGVRSREARDLMDGQMVNPVETSIQTQLRHQCGTRKTASKQVEDHNTAARFSAKHMYWIFHAAVQISMHVIGQARSSEHLEAHKDEKRSKREKWLIAHVWLV